jgi:hypothetical protein
MVNQIQVEARIARKASPFVTISEIIRVGQIFDRVRRKRSMFRVRAATVIYKNTIPSGIALTSRRGTSRGEHIITYLIDVLVVVQEVIPASLGHTFEKLFEPKRIL